MSPTESAPSVSRWTVERSRSLPGRFLVFDRETGDVAREHNGQPSTHGRRAIFDRSAVALKFADRANRLLSKETK